MKNENASAVSGPAPSLECSLETTAKKPAHYDLLDSIRGLCLLSMALYHAMYDVVFLLKISVPWYTSLPGHLWQRSICCTFLLLSGFCWNFSRRPAKRGWILVGLGAAVTLITWIFMPSEIIQYGVLTLLGLSALLLIPLEKLFRKTPAFLGVFLCLALFFLLQSVPKHSAAWEAVPQESFWEALYQNNWFAVLGFPSSGFYSSDYFPLIPWFFLFTAGYFLHRCLMPLEKVRKILQHGFSPLSFLGKHSLIFYLLHQPLLLLFFLPFQFFPGLI